MKTGFFFILLCCYCFSHAQVLTPAGKRELLTAQQDNLETYTDSVIQTGKEFEIGNLHSAKFTKRTHPFFESNKWEKGQVIFNGTSYNAQTLKYDIVADRLIYFKRSPTESFPLALKETFVSDFEINNHHFKYYKGQEMKPGYYEVLAEGKATLLVQWRKKESLSSDGQIAYKTLSTLYLIKQGKYQKVLNLFVLNFMLRDKRKELKKETNKLSIDYFNKLKAAKTIVEEYNKL